MGILLHLAAINHSLKQGYGIYFDELHLVSESPEEDEVVSHEVLQEKDALVVR